MHRPFWDIISHLSEECGGNVGFKGIVNVTVPQTYGFSFYRIVEDSCGCWESREEPSSWICFDSKDKCVQPTAYTLRSGEHGLLHWVIEGSDDGKDWKEVDNRDTKDLKHGGTVMTYKCSSRTPESFRYLRLRQTGKNNERLVNQCLSLSKIEFSGFLKRN